MRFELGADEIKGAKVSHELFLINLIGNHILWFVAALGVVSSVPQPLMLVPVISIAILGFTLWRARRALTRDPWFVRCHWQIAAHRSWLFIAMLGLLGFVSTMGWLGYTYLGMKKVEVLALIGGIGLLPVMVTVLVLIIMESDALYQAHQGRLPRSVVQRYPNPQMTVLEE